MTTFNKRVKTVNAKAVLLSAKAHNVTATLDTPKNRFYLVSDLHSNMLDVMNPTDRAVTIADLSNKANADMVSVIFHKTSSKTVKSIFDNARANFAQ